MGCLLVIFYGMVMFATGFASLILISILSIEWVMGRLDKSMLKNERSKEDYKILMRMLKLLIILLLIFAVGSLITLFLPL